MRKLHLAVFLALFALASSLACGPVWAQSTSTADATQPAPAAAGNAAAGEALQEVTVSASAITISGYDQPTPVSSIGMQQIQSAAQPDLSDTLRAMPEFAGSSSPENSVGAIFASNGVAGADTIDLRGLGATLVLLDGQRVTPANYGTSTSVASVDTAIIPSSLVERVDVVKGGASAIWGSDAVAGVVNYVLNHNFNGVQINLQDSNNIQSEHQQSLLELAAGTGFDDNRGHIEGSVSEHRVPNAYFNYQIEGYGAQWLLNNPACNLASGTPDAYTGLICPPGQSPLVHASNVNLVSATGGGIVASCKGQVGPCPLTNTYFVGPNATPQTFMPGNNVTSDFLSTGGTPNTVENTLGLEGSPWKQDTAFMLGSFKLTDHVEATLQFDYGYDSIWADTTSREQLGNLTIYSGNPFIPASIQSLMNADGITSLKLGTTNTNPFEGPAPTVQAWQNSVGTTVLFESRRLMRAVFGLDGDLGANWSWKAYYNQGETRQYEDVTTQIQKSALADAENAVTVGNYSAASGYNAAAYPNPLGLTPGSITCLSNLLPIGAKGETANCVPLNVFGTGPGVASPAAINYIHSLALAGGDTQHTDIFEKVASASVQGKLPFGLPAGPVALAAGLLWRQESAQLVNCGANCNNFVFYSSNFTNFYGLYDIREASVELNAPLLKDQGVKDLSFNAAYRGTDYSTSGFVNTYKLGIVSQLTDTLRLRASYSVDIAAGSLAAEFQTAQAVGGTYLDPRTNQVVNAYTVSEGNPNVEPERAEWRTAGFVFTPVQGLTASLDWYYAMIKNVFGTVGEQQTLSLCQAGNTEACQNVVWGTYPGGCSGASYSSCPGQPLAAVLQRAINLDSETISGLDFVADYRTRFLAGSLDFNTDAQYLFQQRYTDLGTTCDALNGASLDQYDYASCNGTDTPKFRATAAVSYSQGGWLGTVQARMVGAQHLVTQWINTNEVDNNDIPFYTVVDLRLSYAFGNGIQLYGAVDNVGNRLPPVVPSSPYSGQETESPPYVDTIYDVYGLVWRLGLRAKF